MVEPQEVNSEEFVTAHYLDKGTHESGYIEWKFSTRMVGNTILTHEAFINGVNWMITKLMEADPTIKFQEALELAKWNYLLGRASDEHMYRSTLYEIVMEHIHKYLPKFSMDVIGGMKPGQVVPLKDVDHDIVVPNVPLAYDNFTNTLNMRDFIMYSKELMKQTKIWNASWAYELAFSLVLVANVEDPDLSMGSIYEDIRKACAAVEVTQEYWDRWKDNINWAHTQKWVEAHAKKDETDASEWYPNKDVDDTLEMMEAMGTRDKNFTPTHPAYYNEADITPFEYIRAQNLNFFAGNVIKYISRAGKKDPQKHVEDLEKAKVYLDEEIKHVRGLAGGSE